MLKNIIFDMGGVILPMRPIEEPIRRFAALGLSENHARRLFGLHGQQGIFLDVESGAITADQFLHAFSQLTGRRATFADIEWAWRGFVQDPPPERLEWLTRLRQAGYRTALLSNTNPFLMRHCDGPDFTPQGHPISHYFHRVHYSYLLGACKPDPHAFHRMLTDGGYNPSECIFLDDALHNVHAARLAGMRALHIPDNRPWLQPLLHALHHNNG